LPKELRDIIYELVLAEEGGLIADAVLHLNKWTQFSANSIQTDGSRESNQLRYVCRQLYEETSRLCLRYNDLTFCCQDETARRNFITVYDVFDHFHNNCAQHLLGDIRRITKLDDATDPPTVLTNFEDLLSPPLVRYCREFPQATVLVRFEWVDAKFETYEDIDCMISISQALERPNPFPSDAGQIFGGLSDILEDYFGTVDCPRNQRFSCSHILDGERVKKNTDRIGRDVGDREQWMTIARKVHEEGI
jgi:hypothetical protein